LQPFVDHPQRSAVLADYDGTLAPVVSDPSRAVPLPGTSDLLVRLARRYGRVAVISGRPVRYLLDQLGSADGVALAGLYGLERANGGDITVSPEAVRWRQAVEQVAAAAGREAPAGVGVEPKGLAVTLHYRNAPEQAGWVERFAFSQAETHDLAAHPGRRSIELRPPVDTDKGSVVAELAAGLDAVCYFGDDTGDLPAFAELARLQDRGVATLGVVVASDESPPSLRAAADLVVDGPEGVMEILRRLVA
jgi:trehalose 6-phosphate phosphatase